MLLHEEEDFDDEQHFILEEVVRYLDNEALEGGFQQMASGWPGLIQKIFSTGQISGTDGDVLSAIKSWHQQQANICIWLGRELQRHVSLHLNRSHRESQSIRLLEDAEEFVATKQLRATFHSSALSRPIDVIADALRRNVTAMIGAPEDRRRYQSRMSWLLEQLPEGNLGDTMVHIAWDNGQKTSVALKRLRANENEGRWTGRCPSLSSYLEVLILLRSSVVQNFSLRAWTQQISSYCDLIARHLRAWQPRPVRAEKEQAEVQEEVPDKVIVREANIPGGTIRVFDDGSIELQTAAGTRWFRSFAELERSLRDQHGAKPTSNGNGESNEAMPIAATPVNPPETLPTSEA